ncbi:MAG TPA: IPT/TIG domain-containing protein, partial [Clostridia bacterium]
VDMNHIYFRVPPLPADGYYDITVLNPDTKKDSKIGDKGFYYFGQPQSRPQIDKIYPSQGSVDGGYSVTISGKDFEDNGSTKTRVYLNGIEADSKNVNVSIDGSTITFIVPAYPGDLMKDLGTNQINVPLIIVNPDGASCSIENGFTYVIPGSHPKITNIVPSKGAASGGDIVEITGSDFRFFEPFTDKNKNLVRDSDEVFTDINGNGTWDSEPDKTTASLPDNVTYSTYYTSPILPSVFFGSQKAQIVEYSRGYLKVIVPPGSAGTANVYVVNNDAGTSNKVAFIYESSNPSITKITPSQGKKQGGDNVEIAGTGFQKNTIYVYNASTDSTGNNLSEKVTMPLVNFGGITNRNKLREEANSGRIDAEKTTVNLDGNLSIGYDASLAALKLTLTNNKIYQYTINGYDGSVKFVPLSLLKDDTGASWNGFELVRFEISNKRLFVDRGYSTAVQYLSGTLLSVSTPTYYTVGNVPVRIENPDKGQATGTFIYKNPSSAPVIRNITKEDQQPSDTTVNGKAAKVIRASINGGSVINITGDDFRDNARVQISDILEITPDKITYSLPNHITFQLPSVPDSVLGKFYRIVVLNEDGGSAASDGMSTPIYISFTKGETKPSVKNVSPSSGPAVGGTRVKLEGSDFRQTMEGFDSKLMVYFGDTRIPDSDIAVSDYKTIYVTAPAHYAGKVKVRVQNPDGEVSPEDAGYTYISCPKIIAAVDGSSSGDNTRISTVSIKGGQVIKIKGSGFLSGATVMFNPTEVLYDGSTQGQTIYTVNKTYILTGGTAGTNVNVLDLETLTVTVPAGKLGTSGIIVINPDGGASDIYGDITYGLPAVSVPANVKATLSYNRYIKISWSAVTGAKSYEVYASLDGGSYGFIGSTALTEFLYKDLKPGVTYKFTVKALGDYGPSNASAESNSVTTGGTVGPPDTDGSLTDNTVIQKSGSSAAVVIGRNSLKSSSYVIDLTTGDLAGCKDVTVSVPASVINGLSNNDIIINGEDIKIKLSPYAFKTTLITQNSSRSDAGVRLSVSRYNGSSDIHLSEGTPLSNQYIMEVNTFVGKDSTSMKYLNSQIELTMDYDSQKADMRRIQNLGVSRYENGSWMQLSGGITTLNSIIVPVDRPGRYLVVGRR